LSSAWQVRPNAPQRGTFLTTLAALDAAGDGAAIELRFGQGRMAFSMIVVNCADGARAYVNLCPHYSMPLDAGTGRFVNADGLVECLQHFALFRVEDGACVAGACEGASLDPIPLQCDAEGRVFIGG
jgi:nitrite reductase/ring-hydroxylating ferredoxin subunit